MTRSICASWMLNVLCLAVQIAGAEGPATPIQRVETGTNAELRVNGKPFLPLMLWLQSDARIPDGLSIGVNTFAGNGGNLGAKEYLDALSRHGLYGVIDFDPAAIGHSHLLGWIHGDEPDLPHDVYDAEVVPGSGMRVNKSTPLARIVDGVTHTWSVLDPLKDAQITIELKKPVTIQSLTVWLTVSSGLAVAQKAAFLADGQPLLEATLENKAGEQRFRLPKPATLKSLTLRVLSTYPGKEEWGSIGEITAEDESGKNVLLSPPRAEPRRTVAAVAEDYRKIKQADPSRPVFLTCTSQFMRAFEKYDAARKAALYPGYVASCDVVGFDIYPIFGWAKPEWLSRVAEGTGELRAIAGPKRPLYAWIETNKGSRWVSPPRQIDVTPQDTRAEVWMAVIRGATAIGYFTHRWVPDYKQFAPEGAMVDELRRINGQLTRLAPAILAGPAADAKITFTIAGGLSGHFKATVFDGHLHIFAQNIDMRRKTASATISVPGLRSGSPIEVLDENRSITARDGEFVDDFTPLQEHAYRLPR